MEQYLSNVFKWVIMPAAQHKNWIRLQPKLSRGRESFAHFLEHAQSLMCALSKPETDDRGNVIAKILDSTLTKTRSWPSQDRIHLSAAIRVLTDLALQRWKIRVANAHVEVCAPIELHSDPVAEKERVRRQELLKRDEQLAQPAVRKFVKEMEGNRLYGQRLVSIFSLMRDGRELAEALRTARQLPRTKRADALKNIIAPYLQFISGDTTCKHTGLRLQDIWRYFRHTWTNQYTSIPGRTMMFIIRDRATPLHPVIGIGAIGSPIIQIKERDSWIGWHPTAFFETAQMNPTAELGEWLRNTVECAINEIYIDDLIEDQIITVKESHFPTSKSLTKLAEYSAEQRRLHHRYVRSQEHKTNWRKAKTDDRNAYWIDKARSHLFRSKRALALSELLRARMVINDHLSEGIKIYLL
jgi:hypothetical protein